MGSRQNVDRLSNMPEEVISYILSLIPTKYAVRTSVLSKSWIHSWKSVTNLDIDAPHPVDNIYYFIKFVDRVLECCKASQVKLFRLHCSEISVLSANIKKWIAEAIRLNVPEIEIHSFLLEFPHPFICKTLTNLTLVCHSLSVWNVISPIDLPHLKTLDIKLGNSSLNAFKIIRGCPLLESLSLEVKYDDGDDGYNFNIPTLKRLKLNTGQYGTCKKVVLNLPNLEDLFVSGGFRSFVVMENCPRLVSVTLSLFFEPGLHQSWVELLTGISGAKSITMNLPTYNPSKLSMLKFLNLKRLEFRDVYGSQSDWLKFNQVIDSSYELEHLCIVEKPKRFYTIKFKSSYWIKPQRVSTCILNNLKTIKFVNFKGWEWDIQFMAYMLGNAQVLKTLAIMYDSIPLEEELRISAELLKFPRASRHCEVHFIASRSHSTST